MSIALPDYGHPCEEKISNKRIERVYMQQSPFGFALSLL